jgi:hypothetical protein
MKNLLGKNKPLKSEIFLLFQYQEKLDKVNNPNFFEFFFDVLDRYMYTNYYKTQLITSKFTKPL